jgi:hypothetical protein
MRIPPFRRNIMPPSSGLKTFNITTLKTKIDIFTTVRTSNIIQNALLYVNKVDISSIEEAKKIGFCSTGHLNTETEPISETT